MEKKIMQYKLLTASKMDRLEAQVNELLGMGWKLHGSPFSATYTLCQAVTKGEYPRPNRVQAKEQKQGKNDD
jgi:hypothetical protein